MLVIVKSLKAKHLLLLFVGFVYLALSKKTAGSKNDNCYRSQFLNLSWKDSRPDFSVNLTVLPDGGINSVWHVNRVIPMPVFRFAAIISQRMVSERTIYNITTKLCELKSVLNKVPMFKIAAQAAFKQTNITFSCPLKPAIYSINSLRINQRNPLFNVAHKQKADYCYFASFLNSSLTDSRPDYAVNMTFDDSQGSISTTWQVNRVIHSPIARFALSSHNQLGRDHRTLYNMTAKLCEIQSLVERVPLLRAAMHSAFRQSNFSFRCPLEPGVYAVPRLRVNSRNPLFVLAYQQGISILVQGGLSEELPSGSVRQLSYYFVDLKITKKRC